MWPNIGDLGNFVFPKKRIIIMFQLRIRSLISVQKSPFYEKVNVFPSSDFTLSQ